MTAKQVHSESRKTRADAADRAMRAWQARVLGMDWAKAAEYAGYADAATACRGVRNYFGQLPQIDTEERRKLWQERVEYLWRRTVHELQETPAGHNAANLRAAVAVAQRAAALDGLDQPSRVEVYRPDEQEFVEVVNAMRQQLLGGLVEGDPFAEPIDDDMIVVESDRT